MTLLLLHGTGPGATGAISFAPLLPGLAQHECVVPDMVGFGDAMHPEDVEPGPGPWFERRVQGVLDALGDGGPVDVVGHSYGARVAIELLRRAPEKLGRVVLMSAGGTPVKADLGKLKGFYAEPTIERMREVVAAQFSRSEPTDDLVRARFEMATRPDVQRSFQAAMGEGPPAPIYQPDDLCGITHDVLVVHGRDDATIAPGAGLYLAEHLPNADLALFAGCGHLIQFEVPDRLSALIDGFLG